MGDLLAGDEIIVPARMLGQINLPTFCPQCYWIRLRYPHYTFPFGIPMPGIFSSIDSYSKKIIHSFFDYKGQLPDWFPNIGKVKSYEKKLSWQNFNFTHDETNIKITGVPDDIFKMDDDSYHILDYKTSKLTQAQDQLFPLYDIQLNAYALVAKQIGLTPVAAASLVYMEPQTDIPHDKMEKLSSQDVFAMEFKTMLKPIALEPEKKILPLLEVTRQIYDNLDPPKPLRECRNCELTEKFISIAGHRS
jgi:hypothetical protein